MIFEELGLEGAWLIKPEPFVDERGSFRRHFCGREFKANGIPNEVCQGNISVNKKKHTMRGFHYQVKPYEEYKTISCLTGKIYDIIVDLRRDSKTYKKWVAVTISGDDGSSIHVPAGCGNAFLTLEDNTIIHYYHSEYFQPNSYQGFHWNDPQFNFVWQETPQIISQRDSELGMYSETSHRNLEEALLSQSVAQEGKHP